MRQALVATEPSFLRECFQVPKVRDRLERGMKSLQELGELRRFLEQSREEKLLQREYGYLLQDLEFLELEGALKLPEIEAGRYLTVRDHWVALKGYFDAHDCDLENEGMAKRFIINTPSVRTPVLALDSDAWKIYNQVIQHRDMSRYQALCYLLHLLEILMMTQMPLGEVVDDQYIHHVVLRNPPEHYQTEAERSFENLRQEGKIDDPRKTLLKVVEETYCLPSNNWIFSDGLYFIPSLPSWSLTDSNYVENWDFFTCDV